MNFSKPPTVDAYDRVKIVCGAPLPKAALTNLEKKCQRLVSLPSSREFSPASMYVLEVFGPYAEFFEALMEAAGADIQLTVAYVEVARDYITRTSIEAARLTHHFLATTVFRYSRDVVTSGNASAGSSPAKVAKNGGGGRCYYFGPRQRGKVLVLYSDRDSDLSTPSFGRPCLHTEIRLRGKDALCASGICSIHDLANFDFTDFWKKWVRHFELPSRLALGRVLGGTGHDDSVRRHAKRMLARPEFYVAENFALQNFCTLNPRIKAQLLRIESECWESEIRSRALYPNWFHPYC